jgi:hypothetical protein
MVSQEVGLPEPASSEKGTRKSVGMKAVGQETSMRRQTVFERMLGTSRDPHGFETAVLRRLSFQ